MTLLVTGSIGIDTVRTPHGVSENCLGGSAVYFTMAASLFSPVRFLGAVGHDCPFDLKDVFKNRQVDWTGLETRSSSKTFRWAGSYEGTMNSANTDMVELNILAEAPPTVPASFADSKFVFLANTAPALQSQLLSQIAGPTFVAADTMNLWIQGQRDDLCELLGKIDCLFINEDEARMLTGSYNLVEAADGLLSFGPKVVVIKKGESGSMTCTSNGEIFMLPAYPARLVKDPTGAGDSFAGAFMGYVAKNGDINIHVLRQAAAYGTVVASFTISDFSLAGLSAATLKDIDSRFNDLQKLTRF